MQTETSTQKADSATAEVRTTKSRQLYRVESNIPCGGQFETHTLREWKRIYGYEMGHPFVRLIQI